MLLKFAQYLFCVSIYHFLGTGAQWSDDGDPRQSAQPRSRIFFEEAEREIAQNLTEVNAGKAFEIKPSEKFIDDKTFMSPEVNKKNETTTVPQIKEEKAINSRTKSTRRRRKKIKAVKKERKPLLKKKSSKNMKIVAIADGKEKNEIRRSAVNSDLKKRGFHKGPAMKYLHFATTIRARYLRTMIMASVQNNGPEEEININVILPRRAIITKFETWINGKRTSASVKEINGTISVPKAEVYGINVGTKLVRARDCDAIAFSVSFQGLMTYTITYEYLLERSLGFYRIPTYIHTNQWIEDLLVTWRIHEDRNLTKLQTPSMHRPNSLPIKNSDDPSICLTHEEPGIAELVWQPTIEEQKNISRSLIGKGAGVVGVLEVNYDVARDDVPFGEVVRQEEWFAHFYTPPPDEVSHTKHVVFILDVSESMEGKPLEQLKIAISSSLDKLKSGVDRFTVINFAEHVHILDATKANNTMIFRSFDMKERNFATDFPWPGELPSNEVTFANAEAAKRFIQKMKVRKHTNVFDGLYMGYKAIIDAKMRKPQQHMRGLNDPHFIVFVNSGRVSGTGAKNIIFDMVNYLYRLTGAPIFALGLGPNVDRDLMRKLAAMTRGKEKHIYRDSDTHQQITSFFDNINWPVHTHYSAKFDPKEVITSSLTKQTANVAFRGTEILIGGQLNPVFPDPRRIHVDISALSDDFINNRKKLYLNLRNAEDFVEAKYATASTKNLSNDFSPVIPKSPGTVEKIWAFKTLMDLQEKIDSDEAFRRSDEVKLEYGDAISFHQPTLCDDPLQPNEKILEIALRFKYAISRVTNLIYNNTALQRISVDPEIELNPDWKIRSSSVGRKSRVRSQVKTMAIRRIFTTDMNTEESHVSSLSCNNSVNNQYGECRLISDCPDIRLYTTKKVFRRHVCKIGTTTGVCCPKSVPRPMQYIE